MKQAIVKFSSLIALLGSAFFSTQTFGILGSVGARFFVTPNQRLEGKLMYEQLRYNNQDSTTAYVNYTIGF